MCYSAIIKAQHAAYRHMTGAELDLDQCGEILDWTPQSGERRIVPRAVERWFDNPGSEQERRIHDSIAARRAAQATAWQRELFVQRRRLADAERKVAGGTARSAADSRRLAARKIEALLKKLGTLNDTGAHSGDARFLPMHYAPIVIDEGGRRVIRLARYHCRLPGKSVSVDGLFPGLYNARRGDLQKYWRVAFGTSHALLLADSFFENVSRGGRNAVLHFQPRPADTMLIACLYAVWTSPGGGSLLSFAAITDDPPPEVAATGHDRMIINLQPQNVDAWLTPQRRTDAELQAILGERRTAYYEHEVLAA